MKDAARQNLLNLEHDRKGTAIVLVRCQHHFSERSDHAIRLKLIDVFRKLQATLNHSGVRFRFDRLAPEKHGILATVPVAEMKLFQAFLHQRNMDMKVIKLLSAPVRPSKVQTNLLSQSLRP